MCAHIGIAVRIPGTHPNSTKTPSAVNFFCIDKSYWTAAIGTAHDRPSAFGGARRDEEASRAKERVFSFRAEGHRWDPRKQRAEMFGLLNGLLWGGIGATPPDRTSARAVPG